ncbi:MAG: lysophospholipid acyltransferase family protein [Paludibacter sp.]|nr:lysophospholipid acyltransferase family protein [Paludibacter sp.]
MILKAKHNFIVYPFFKWYAGFLIRRHNSTVKIIGEFKDRSLPVLLISNHISWWDGFWAMYINQNVLHRKFHFMMLEEQLRKYWFFNFTGGFSVNKSTKSIVETLNYTSGLLTDKENMVLIFPQGEIQSLHNQSIQFERGLERILRNKENAVQVVFLVNLIDYFSNPKPGIYFHIREYTEGAFDLKSIQQHYTEFYADSVGKQMTFNQ